MGIDGIKENIQIKKSPQQKIEELFSQINELKEKIEYKKFELKQNEENREKELSWIQKNLIDITGEGTSFLQKKVSLSFELKDLKNALVRLEEELRFLENNLKKGKEEIQNETKKQLSQITDKKKDKKTIENNFGIENRGDVKKFIHNLWVQKDIGKIGSEKDFTNQIIDMYEIAFNKELLSLEGIDGINNIKKYEPEWRKIFNEVLGDILSKKDAESLFLLSWVESSGQNTKANKYGATGFFQITPEALEDVNRENNLSYKKSDLNDPILSAEIASKHLKTIIKRIRKDHPNIKSEKIIDLAITKYNGGLYNRLNGKYETKTINSIFEIYKDLNWIKKDKKIKNADEMINRLKKTQNKYYSIGKNHFGILDKIDNGDQFTREQINKFIDNYIKKVLTQQNMYALQFRAIQKSYSNYQNKNYYAKN